MKLILRLFKSLTWFCPWLVHAKEMGFAIMADARAVRSIHDSAVGADDIHDAPVFQRARPHFMRLQTLRITSGDVAPQPLRDRRTKQGRDPRLWMFQKWENRRCILKSVTCGKPPQKKLIFLGLQKLGGGTENGRTLPVKIISGRHNRSIEPGTRLFLTKIDRTINQYMATRTVQYVLTPNAHLSQNVLALSIFC
jgi:hypothetical protein